VGEILLHSLAGTPLGRRLDDIRVWQVWEKGVGERIARVASPLSMRDGTLTVGVTNAPWLQELQLLKREIITRLNGLLGGRVIRDIFFRSAGPRHTPHDPSPPPRLRELSHEELQAIRDQVSRITDPELADRLSRLLIAARRRSVP